MPDENKSDKTLSEGRETTVYEVGYLLQPLLVEENIGEEITKIKNAIEERGGLFISEGWPEQRILAYSMTHEMKEEKKEFDSAYFGWVKFEAKPGIIPLIQDELRKNENIIRFILVKTVREDTMSRPVSPARQEEKRRSRRSREEEGKEEISEEEVDKAIEEMLDKQEA